MSAPRAGTPNPEVRRTRGRPARICGPSTPDDDRLRAEIDRMGPREIARALALAAAILRDRRRMHRMREMAFIVDLAFDIYCSTSVLCDEGGAFPRGRDLLDDDGGNAARLGSGPGCAPARRPSCNPGATDGSWPRTGGE